MTSNPTQFCRYCGARLESGLQFCENCGRPVAPTQTDLQAAPPASAQPPVAPPQGIYPPAPPPPAKPKRRNWTPWILVFGIGCIGVICVGVLLVGSLFYINQRGEQAPTAVSLQELATPVQSPTQVEEVIPTQAATLPPAPTDLPPQATSTPAPQPTETQAPPEVSQGTQYKDEHSLFDDFSSPALGWAEDGDEIVHRAYLDGAYAIAIRQPEYIAWSFVPVEFDPFEIEFDVSGPEGAQYGTFGVMCQYQDDQNYYFVDFDLGSNDFRAGVLKDDETTILTDPEWVWAENMNYPPEVTNHIQIGCYPDVIEVHVNGEIADILFVNEPFEATGDMALYVWTWDNLEGMDGYRIKFDNVSAWRPVQ